MRVNLAYVDIEIKHATEPSDNLKQQTRLSEGDVNLQGRVSWFQRYAYSAGTVVDSNGTLIAVRLNRFDTGNGFLREKFQQCLPLKRWPKTQVQKVLVAC